MNIDSVLLCGLIHLQNINKSLDKKKNLLIELLKIHLKARSMNSMLVTCLNDDADFESHFRLTRSSVEVNKLSFYNFNKKYFIFL